MDWELFIGVLSPALIVLISGLIWQKFPPGKINQLYGYRTERSMKNQQTWDFANRIGPVMFLRTGTCLLIIGALAFWLVQPVTAIWISVVTMVVGLIAGIIACEKKLAQHFDEDGNPKGKANFN